MRSIHFIGIKGVGMTPLAIIAKEAGFIVTGCDVAEDFITDVPLKETGIVVSSGFHSKHLENIDLVITTGAHGGLSNPEVKAAKEKGLAVMLQGEAVGKFMDGALFTRQFKGISVAGCHGKTTTTAMIATIFAEAGVDPSYVIGTSDVSPLGLPGHYGKGEYFIAEADEYANEPVYDRTPKFLFQKPEIAVITNIEHDHPDLYPTIDSVRDAYLKFTKQIEGRGLLIANGDDTQTKLVLQGYKGKVKTFGFGLENDYVIQQGETIDGRTEFILNKTDKYALSIPGKHNIMNAAVAAIVAQQAGISYEKIKQGLVKFTGTKRRLEFIGKLPTGALLYDDYAHHPTEIQTTLNGLKQLYSTKKLVCIFQPHTYSRTKLLLEEFSDSFYASDIVILTNIFPSAREPLDTSISSEHIVEKIIQNTSEEKFNQNTVLYLAKLPDVIKYIKEQGWGEDTVIVTMGAGDVYKIGLRLYDPDRNREKQSRRDKSEYRIF